MKKTATPTGNENEYKIDLEVITTETSSTKAGDAATVLVIDVSGSMDKCAECGYTEGYSHNWNYGHNFKSRIAAAQTAAKQFIDAFKSDSAKRYVSVVRFSDNASVACEWKDVSTLAGYKAAIKAIEGLSADGGTNLDAGLQTANTQLSKTTVASIKANAKNVIALTDGMPTYYQGASGSVSNHASTGCPITNYRTAASATTLKNSTALYTVCFGASNDKCWSDWEYNKRDDIYEYGSWPGKKYCSDSKHAQDGPTVGDFLKNSIATQATNDKTYAYNAANTNDLLDVFKSITDTITEGISAGTVKDGLPTGVSFVGDAPTAFVENADGTYSWELIPENAEKGTDGGKTTYTYKVSYVVKLDTTDPEFNEGIYHALNTKTTFTAGGKVYNFNVPGVQGTAPKYKVTYEFEGNHPDSVAVPASEQHKAGENVKMPEITAPEGWIFNGWKYDSNTVTSVEMPASDITIIGTFTERKAYTVKYLLNGTDISVKDADTGTKNVGESVEATAPDLPGYTFAGTDADKNQTITVVSDASKNVITFYYYKNVELVANSATVTYDGKEHSVSGFTGAPEGADFSAIKVGATGTEAGTYPANFADNTVGTVDATGKYIVTKTTNGNLIIDPIGTVTVTITGKHDSKVYNGSEQSVTGYTTDVGDKAITVALKEGKTAIAKGTNVGNYKMGLTAEDFEVSSNNYSEIKVVVVDGYLDITPVTDEVVVTITGNHAEKIYNGTEQSVEGYTVDVPDSSITVVHKEGKTAIAKGTDVGNYKMGLTAADFDVSSKNYSKIEVLVEDGYLDITPITDEVVVTITGHKDEFTYDGKEHTVKGYETSISNPLYKATDFTFTGKAEVSRTEVGTSDMGLKNDLFQNVSDNFTNVKFVINDGSITIKERPYRPNPSITDKITVEITGNSDSVVYDGTERSVKDYTVKISDSRYTEKDFTFSGKALASGVNAGAYEMGLKADQFKNTNARFKNVEFIIKADGVLTITQRPLTITAGSAEGIAPVTCDKYTVEGLATGDKVDSVKITGIQSEPGESPNVASDAVIKNAKGEDVTANYKITYVNGVLKAIEVLNKEIHFNYVIGYTDGTIRPNNDISRAEVATIFFRLLTDEAREQYTTTAGNFTDVKAGMWCNRAIATLTNMGIIKGYTDGSFQPNKSITRAELATIIARFAKLDVNTKTFSDINGHWAQKNIELAAGNGWINGYEDGTFRPNNNITRAETFAMINRVLDRQTESVSDLLPTSEMNMWSDNLNENAWYYKDIQEATNYHKCDRVGDSVYEKWTEKVPDIDWASYQI